MTRRATAWVLVVAVQIAALAAPLVHAHPDDHADDHHHAAAVHAHFTPHRAAAASKALVHLEGDEAERTIYLQVYVAVAPVAFEIPLAALATFELGPPAESPAQRPVHVVHGHDPPAVTLLPPRAPPLISLS